MQYPSILFWALLIHAAWSRGPAIYYLFFASWAFGTLAVIPPALIGGTSIASGWVVAGVLCLKEVRRVGIQPMLAAMIDPRRFGVLTLCTLYAVVTALLMPRLFQGQVDVVAMKVVAYSTPEALGPTMSNYIQSLYFMVTSLTTVCLFFVAADPRRRVMLLSAFRFGGMIVIATGVADLGTSALGLSSLLEPFRNSTYALMTDAEVANVKRVVGLTSEASAYAGLCMSFLAMVLLQPAQPNALGGGPVLKWALSLGLLAMAYMSLSSGGFVGLAVLAAVTFGVLAVEACTLKPVALLGVLATAVGACAILALWIWAPDLFHKPMQLVDGLVFHKTESVSYAERSMWNRVSFDAFLGTHGFGVGMGGARASSWVFAVLSNIGWPGAALLVMFMLQVFFAGKRGLPTANGCVMLAAKLALIPNLAIASLSGTAVGYGLGNAFLLALITGLAWPMTRSRAATARRSPAIPVPALSISHARAPG